MIVHRHRTISFEMESFKKAGELIRLIEQLLAATRWRCYDEATAAVLASLTEARWR